MNISTKDLREYVLQMASAVEQIIQDALNLEKSMSDIFEIEKKINEFHVKIDDVCFKYIALKGPTATDLRTAIAILKINTDLERMGDEAVKIKRNQQNVKKEAQCITNMGIEVIFMVKNCIDSFVTGNMKMATDVIIHDQEVNALNKDIARTYIDKIKNNEMSFDEAYGIVRMSKNLERIGDHAKNVAEDVIFLVSGSDIRHKADLHTDKK